MGTGTPKTEEHRWQIALEEARAPLDLAGEADSFDVPSLIVNTIIHPTQDGVLLFA